MEYISLIYPLTHSIEFTVLSVDIPKFKTPMISVVVEQEYQRIYKRYIGGVMGIDIRERL